MENESVIIIPQDLLRDFIGVLWNGLLITDVDDDLRTQIEEWISNEKENLNMGFEWTNSRVINFVNWYLNSIGFDDGRMWIKGGADLLIEKFKQDDRQF